MDFTTLQTRVAEETGLDLTNSDDLSSIKAWINATYQTVSGLYSWDWLFKQATIQTVADITTGSATVAANSTTCVLSAAPTNAGSNISVANQWMIKFEDVSADWYFISSHTSGSASLTLSVPFVGSSNLTAGSYILRKVLYTLPTDLDKIIDIRQQIASNKLTHVDARSFDRVTPDPSATGTPQYYSFVGRDTSTSANWQISLYPTPDAILNLQTKYYRHITELSSGTDEPLMPKNWHDCLIYGSLYMFGHPFMDDDRITSAKVRFEDKITSMKSACSHVPDNLTIVQPWDTRASILPRYRLPDNYGI